MTQWFDNQELLFIKPLCYGSSEKSLKQRLIDDVEVPLIDMEQEIHIIPTKDLDKYLRYEDIELIESNPDFLATIIEGNYKEYF